MPENHPDPMLVERALANLSTWIEDAPSASGWEVIERVEFPRSVLFFIGVPTRSASTRLVYKIKTPRQGENQQWDDGEQRGDLHMVNTAVRRLRAEGLLAAPILTVDPGSLTVVTLYVHGELFEPLKWRETRLTQRVRGIYRDIGRACRIAETAVDSPMDVATEALWEKFDRLVDSAVLDEATASRAHGWGSRQLARIAEQPVPYVMAISDMTYSNVVVGDGTTGFIDLGLSVSLRGSSVSKMLHRIEYASRFRSRAADEAIAAVLAGYGPVPDAERDFLRVERLLRTFRGSANRRRVWLSSRRRRALSELRGLIDTP